MILPQRLTSKLSAWFSSPPPCSDLVLVWWGTWQRGATVGDRLAVDNLSRRLREAGLSHSLLSHPIHAAVGDLATSDPFALAPQIKTLVFVCGPMVGTKRVRRLLWCCRHTTVLAAGVSLLEQQQEVNQTLKAFVARDGVPGAIFDLAVDSILSPELHARPERLAQPRIGICLRGSQKDYGADRDQSRLAESLMESIVGRLPAHYERINTVLSAGNTPEKILCQICSVDLLLTTRLHGSLLALASGVPVIALDQISGGGKLTEVLGRITWPYCFPVDKVDVFQLQSLMTRMLENPPFEEIKSCQILMRRLTEAALGAALDMIKSEI